MAREMKVGNRLNWLRTGSNCGFCVHGEESSIKVSNVYQLHVYQCFTTQWVSCSCNVQYRYHNTYLLTLSLSMFHHTVSQLQLQCPVLLLQHLPSDAQSINVSPHSQSVAMFSTATTTLTFWRSVSKSVCAFLNFSVSMSRRVARPFVAFCSHFSVARSFPFELHNSRYSSFTSSDSLWPSLSQMLKHTIFIYLLFLASWMKHFF